MGPGSGHPQVHVVPVPLARGSCVPGRGSGSQQPPGMAGDKDLCSREVLESWGGSGTPSQPLVHLAVGKSARGFDAAFGECL